MKFKSSIIAAAVLTAACAGPKDGEYTLTLLSTNDIHGHYFDSTYVGDNLSKSLMSVKCYVDSIRSEKGADNVLLLDAGDILQGDNVAYYFNYVDTVTPHIYPRMAKYMGYDAVTVGNHDVETAHPVYDRIARDMKAAGIPFLAGNAIRNDNGKPYFPLYKIFKKGGLKVAVLGYTNPNMKEWLSENVWSGMHFESLIPLVQQDVDRIREKEKPQVVIVSIHSGTGRGDGSMLESQGLDLYNSLRGVDFLFCSHDHRPFTAQNDSIALINAGSHCRNLGIGTLKLTIEGGKVTAKSVEAGLIPIDENKVDKDMQAAFHDDYLAVKAFTVKELGELKSELRTSDAFRGMSDYVNLVHTLQLGCAPAEISIAAPLTYNGVVKAGTLIYNDLFTIYPYENQLFVIRMSGQEIKDYLEFSYDNWIQTIARPGDHIFKIRPFDDPRTGQRDWSFVGRSYNFDSAAGINYTVDVTKPFGERIAISTMADGTPFDLSAEYNVAMTSYRASGGGDLLSKGAHVDTDRIDERVVERYPEIRNILYDYLVTNGAIDPAVTGDPARIGSWKFVPEKLAEPALDQDMALMFKK